MGHGHLYTCLVVAAAVNIVAGQGDELQAEIDRLIARIQTARSTYMYPCWLVLDYWLGLVSPQHVI
jgi:hypothetical protein